MYESLPKRHGINKIFDLGSQYYADNISGLGHKIFKIFLKKVLHYDFCYDIIFCCVDKSTE